MAAKLILIAGMITRLILIDGLGLITKILICAWVVRHWNNVCI